MSGRVKGHKGPGLFSFRGRAGRGEWWGWIVWATIVSAVLGAGGLWVAAAPWILIQLAVTARRLHDLGRSAWLQAIPLAVWAVWMAAVAWLDPPGDGPLEALFTWTLLASLAGQLGLWLWLGVAKGRAGPNAYGEADPI